MVTELKKKIHPAYRETEFKCACGNTIVEYSTSKKSEKQISICSACHNFYTGKRKFADETGSIKKFENKYKKFNEKLNENKVK